MLAARALGAVAITVLQLLPACGGAAAEKSGSGERFFGYISAVDTAARPATITVDRAEFLTGEEAQAAAVADGVVAEGDPVPNDYYVRNPDKELAILPVADDVRATAIRCPNSCTEGVPGNFRDFAASFEDDEPKTLADEYRGAASQYWITVEDGRVTAIDEQYVP